MKDSKKALSNSSEVLPENSIEKLKDDRAKDIIRRYSLSLRDMVIPRSPYNKTLLALFKNDVDFYAAHPELSTGHYFQKVRDRFMAAFAGHTALLCELTKRDKLTVEVSNYWGNIVESSPEYNYAGNEMKEFMVSNHVKELENLEEKLQRLKL